MPSAAGNRYRRERRGPGRVDPGLGRMLLVSCGGHLLLTLLVLLTVHGGYRSQPVEPYRVNLVALPVANPRAGRPEALPEPEMVPAVKKAPAATVAKTKPTSRPETAPAGKGAKKTAVLPAAKGKAAPSEDGEYDAAQDRIERLRRRQEIDALKARLAALAAKDSRNEQQGASGAGVPDGKGSDPGVTYDAYIRKFLKEAWTLSRYQVASLEREATAELTFDAKGGLSGYRIKKPSGDERFDDSVRRAILDLKQLPTAPGRPFSITVRFNLKELLER